MEDGDGRTIFVARGTAPADVAAEPAGVASRIRPPRARRSRPPPVPPVIRRGRRTPWIVALAVALGWAGAATWFALDGRTRAERLTDEAAEQRRANDDKVRALTRRLVGAASHSLLEQDGLSDRLADIIARQVELENRQATLAVLGDRLAQPRGAVAPGAGAPAAAPSPGSARPPAPPAEPVRPPGRRSSLEGSAGPSAVRTDPAGIARALAALPLREQFDRLDGALAAVAADESRLLATFASASRADIEAVSRAVATVGLRPEAIAPDTPPRRRGGDPFDDEAAALGGVVAARERALALADEVPFRVPLEGGGLTSNFGTRKDPFTGAATLHAGMDFRSPVGTPVHAGAAGRVVTAGPSGGYGNLVEIDHGRTLLTRYAHLSAFAVTVGQSVAAGTPVGLVGSTGRSTGPHLHYETRVAGNAVDPAGFVRAGQALFGTVAAPPSFATPPEEGADD